MPKLDLTKLYETQISLTEWLQKMGHTQSEPMREEDNNKMTRLDILGNIIHLPFAKPTKFLATDLTNNTPSLQKFIYEHGEELCALRLVPIDPTLPKLRMRGYKVKDVMNWFHEQKVDPIQYRADFMPHANSTIMSTIFVVNSNGIFGEIIPGTHAQLTQGFHEQEGPTSFVFDFHSLKVSKPNQALEEHLKNIFDALFVPDKNVQNTLKKTLETTFANDYLCGYFETVFTDVRDLQFIDYNRILGDMYKDFIVKIPDITSENQTLTGQVGSPGQASGKIKLVLPENIATTTLESTDILLCSMTTPEYLPLMQQAGGIVTELGGILSHAAIIARELGKPCLVGVKDCTKLLKDGMYVEVDGDRGSVTILEDEQQ